MPSLMELVDRVNKGELIEPAMLEMYEESSNSAEKFLAHHAHALLDLRRAHQHMLQSLEAIDYSDQKVLSQFMSVSTFLGLTDLRAAPVVKFAASALGRRESALGMDAIQNAIAYDIQNAGAYSMDRLNRKFVAEQYSRAAQAIGWTSETSIDWCNKQPRIALVVSNLADDEVGTRFIRNFVKSHDSKKFKLHVYVTESLVRRDKQQFPPSMTVGLSAKKGKDTIELLNKHKISTWIASTDGDSATTAKDLADQIVKDKIDVTLFDANQSDPIASVVSCWEVSKIKVNLVRKTPLHTGGINCVTYFDQVAFGEDQAYWTEHQVDSRFVLEGIETDAPLAPAPQRSAYGIPNGATVLATAGNDLDRTMSPEFVDSVISLLRLHPSAIFLIIGDGEFGWQKRKFESAGLGKRIGYAGKRRDMPGFLRIADVYLAEFPSGGCTGVLHAMAMERPVVAMKWSDELSHSQTSALIGSEFAIQGREPSLYIERVSRLVREPALRQKVGKALRERLEAHFSFDQTTRNIEQMCEQLLRAVSPAPLNFEEETPKSEAA